MPQCPRCLKIYGTNSAGEVHTTPTDYARNLEARVAELAASLNRIHTEAETMLLAQNHTGAPDDAPERVHARWLYTETNAVLNPR